MMETRARFLWLGIASLTWMTFIRVLCSRTKLHGELALHIFNQAITRVYSLLYLITMLHLIPGIIHHGQSSFRSPKTVYHVIRTFRPLRNKIVSFCHEVLNAASRPALKTRNSVFTLVSTSITMYTSSILQICLLALASLLPCVTAHNIQLGAHSRECFHEQLHKDDKMTVTFQVGDREFGGAGNLEIDFWVRVCNYGMRWRGG